ncbi:hypothetical protein Tco_0144707 [Tanacetum coccineum]
MCRIALWPGKLTGHHVKTRSESDVEQPEDDAGASDYQRPKEPTICPEVGEQDFISTSSHAWESSIL